MVFSPYAEAFFLIASDVLVADTVSAAVFLATAIAGRQEYGRHR